MLGLLCHIDVLYHCSCIGWCVLVFFLYKLHSTSQPGEESSYWLVAARPSPLCHLDISPTSFLAYLTVNLTLIRSRCGGRTAWKRRRRTSENRSYRAAEKRKC